MNLLFQGRAFYAVGPRFMRVAVVRQLLEIARRGMNSLPDFCEDQWDLVSQNKEESVYRESSQFELSLGA